MNSSIKKQTITLKIPCRYCGKLFCKGAGMTNHQHSCKVKRQKEQQKYIKKANQQTKRRKGSFKKTAFGSRRYARPI